MRKRKAVLLLLPFAVFAVCLGFGVILCLGAFIFWRHGANGSGKYLFFAALLFSAAYPLKKLENYLWKEYEK
jgi:hypothetical protein